MLMNDKSVYHFLLTKNKIKWYIGFFCGVFQIATLFLFVHSADMANRNSDKQYTFKCPSNTLECEDSKHTTAYGFFIFILILVIWLLRDIISSVKLLLCSLEKKNIDFFFASGLLFVVTTLSLWTSVTYIIAIVTKNTDLIKDAVVLLFVIEIDERLFQLVESIEPEWVRKIDENMRNSRVYEGKDLVLSTWINKSLVSGQKTFQRLEHFGKGFVNTLEQKKVKEEKDKIEGEEEEIYVEATGDYSL